MRDEATWESVCGGERGREDERVRGRDTQD